MRYVLSPSLSLSLNLSLSLTLSLTLTLTTDPDPESHPTSTSTPTADLHTAPNTNPVTLTRQENDHTTGVPSRNLLSVRGGLGDGVPCRHLQQLYWQQIGRCLQTLHTGVLLPGEVRSNDAVCNRDVLQ